MITPILDGARRRFRVAAAEVDHQDNWQRAELGFAVGRPAPAGHVREVIDEVERFVWSFPEVEVLDVRPSLAGGRLMSRRRDDQGRRGSTRARPGSTSCCARSSPTSSSGSTTTGSSWSPSPRSTVEPDLRRAVGVLRHPPRRRGRRGGPRGARRAPAAAAGARSAARPGSSARRSCAFEPDPAIRAAAPDRAGRSAAASSPTPATTTSPPRPTPTQPLSDRPSPVRRRPRGRRQGGRAGPVHDVVAKARGLLGTRKVGHAGTLDPDATGVLLLGVGRATRLLRFLAALPQDLRRRDRARRRDLHPRRRRRGHAPPTTWARSPSTTCGRPRDAVHRRHPAGAADGVGASRSTAGGSTSWPGRASRSSASPTGHRPPLRRRRPVPGRARWCTGSRSSARRAPTSARSPPTSAHALGGGAHLRNLRRTAIGSFTLDAACPIEALGPERLAPARGGGQRSRHRGRRRRHGGRGRGHRQGAAARRLGWRGGAVGGGGWIRRAPGRVRAVRRGAGQADGRRRRSTRRLTARAGGAGRRAHGARPGRRSQRAYRLKPPP